MRNGDSESALNAAESLSKAIQILNLVKLFVLIYYLPISVKNKTWKYFKRQGIK